MNIFSYFWTALNLISQEIMPYIQDDGKKYILTGHSLGGALASLLAIKSFDLVDVSL